MNQQVSANQAKWSERIWPPYTKQVWEDIRTAARVAAGTQASFNDKKGRVIHCWGEGESSLGEMVTIKDFHNRWFVVFLPWDRDLPASAPVAIRPPERARYNR
jgi:hypothetical protein